MSRIGTWVRGLAVAGLASLMAACGGDGAVDAPDEGEGTVVERSARDQAAAERRERLRQRAADRNEADFTYFRYRVDVSSESPKACLVFSAALDPDTDYEPYLEFRPAFRPALQVSGRELCIGGLAFGSQRTAILKSGLPAADGRTLDRSEEVAIDFADRPPYVGFDGGGVILPRTDADGLPIETVNVDRVDITVSHVPDRALFQKSIGDGRTTRQGEYAYLYGDEDPGDVAVELWSGSMPVEALQNAPVTTVFPLQDVIGELDPGAYFVEVRDARDLAAGAGPPASARRWIVMTDLALTAYRGEDGLDLTLRSLQDGQEVIDARVELIARNNDVLATATTGEDGRVRFAGPILSGSGNAAPKLVMAYGARGDIAVIDLTRAPVDLSELDVGGRRVPGPVDAYVYSERGIYRPGETVHLVALLRDREARMITGRPGELTVRRPNGLVAETVRFEGTETGAVVHDFTLADDAQRGEWRAELTIDGMGRAGGARFAVEDFVPQRVALELAADTDTAMSAGGMRPVEVDARFLYGAPGAGLVVQGRARLEPDPSPFEAFDGFRFGRHDVTFREEIIELDESVADGDGKAVMRLDPGQRGTESDRPLRLNTVVTVLEPGGRPVSESVRVPYRPQELYVGLRSDFEDRAPAEAPARFELAAVSAEGEAAAAELAWKVLAIDYHYDWYREDGEWRWRRSRQVSVVNEGVARTTAGGTEQIEVDGLDWGAHELVVEGPGGAQASLGFRVGWGGDGTGEGVEAPDRVQVDLTEPEVRPGRAAEIAIVPPYDGEAQIVVATDRILLSETRPVSADGTRVTLPVTEEWGEGAYIMVTVFTERDPVLAAKPRRAVGVAYAPVDMAPRTFDMALNAPEVARPRREQLIEVEIADGPREPVFLTLAAVDEGILRLTKYQSPDPVAYYFGKKALGVDLHDDYGRLLDPNRGLPATVRTGGDQLGGEGLSVVPVRTVALWSGEVDLGRSRTARVRFDLPDFNGELRLMAVAWSADGLGAAEATMVVRDPAPTDLVLPRFLAPGDEALATASIDNVELPEGAFEGRLDADGPFSAGVGSFSRTLPEGARADVPVRLTADGPGIGTVSFAVEGPDGFSVDHRYRIESRSPYLPVTRVSQTRMQPGETFTPSPGLFEGLVPGTGSALVSYSALPVDAASLYASLARYPYGCTEQTISRALPLLYSEQLVALSADTGGDAPEAAEDSARREVQETVTRVLNRQSADGAFGLWREGDGHASPWIGAYTTDFLVRARAAGHAVPETALERAYGALGNVATGDAWRVYGYDTDAHESRYHSDTQARLMRRSSAYAHYVLARAGEGDLSRLRYLHDRGLEDIESPLARAHVAAGLAHMGDRARAASAFDAAVAALGYENSGDYYQTPLRDLAGVLALAAETGFETVTADLAERLSRDIPDPTALSTQEKAFLLLAVDALTGGDPDGFRMQVEGLGRGNDNDRRYRLGEDQIGAGVTFTLEGETPVFRTVLVTGQPASAPPPVSNRLRVEKRYATLDGRSVRLGDVRQGDQMVVVIRLEPGEDRINPLIVADLLPAGFEIETVLGPADGRREASDSGAFAWAGALARPESASARDDRFVAALDVGDAAMQVAYIVRAVTPGEFALPGVVAEDMYRADVNARSAAGRVAIAPRDGAAGGQR